MDAIEEQELVKEVRNYVTENLPLSKMSDEDLEDRVEEIVTEKLRNRYCPVVGSSIQQPCIRRK